MNRALLFALASLSVAPSAALAGSCDTWVSKSAKASGDALVQAYKGLVACDAKVAGQEFSRFALRAGDLETLVPLTLVAVAGGVDAPVWEMMERVPYEHRTSLAEQVGTACSDQAGVVTFLKGAYNELKGAQFTSWQPALASCTADDLTGWMAGLIADPPTSPYNEKYNAVLTSYIDIVRADALPHLEAAALLAGSRGGPFNNLLDAMQRAIQPRNYRDTVSADDQKAFEEALVRVAGGVTPDNAQLVADRLSSNGNDTLAASLLPRIYADRVQADGQMLWVAAAVEACDKQAVVHWTTWTEAPTRLSVVEAAAGPLRATKAKLKCTAEGPWEVRASTAPIAGAADASAFVAGLVTEWQGKGFDTKDREEKKLALP